jgi:N-acetylmuramoyl-L-alanine amidase
MGFPVNRLFLLLVLILSGFSSLTVSQPVRQLRTVVIDPGHGGNDPGAVSANIQEKEIVLSVGLRLGNKIKNAYPDVKVVFTRSKDVFIPLYERAARAIRNKADVFISIHANFVRESAVRGTETFTLGLHRSQENLEVAKKENSVILLEDNYSTNYQGFNPNETESYIMFENMQSEYQSQSIILAADIQDAFTKDIGMNNRGVKQAGFLVLRETSMPAVLIEVGFISNPGERKFLASESGKDKISESIFQAFAAYKKMIDQKSRFDLAANEQEPPPPLKTEVLKNQPAPVNPVVMADSFRVNKAPVDTTGTKVINIPKDSVNDQETSVSRALPETKKTSLRSVTKTEAPQPGSEKFSAPEFPKTQPTSSGPETVNLFYSVQLGAINHPIDPTPENFKGVKEVFMVKVNPYYKYYSGKFITPAEANREKLRLVNQFPDAFLVIFENGIPRIYKNR